MKNINPTFDGHVVPLNMSKIGPEDVTSPFAETGSSTGETVSAPFNTPLYPNPLTEVVIEEEAARRVVPECSRARGELSDEEEMVDVVGGVATGMRSVAELEGLSFVDEMKRANLIAASDPGTKIDTSGMPTYKYYSVWQPLVVFMFTHSGHYVFHATSLMRASKFFVMDIFCYSAQSFRGTRSASGCCEPCSWCVWVWI